MAEPTVREILEEQISNNQEPQEVLPDQTIPTETAEQKAERVRDEAGRFAKTDKTDAKSEPKTDLKAQPKVEVPVTTEVQTEATLTPLQRPSSWKKELWPIWDKMAQAQPLTAQESRQVAEYNNSREQQFASGVSTYKQEAERAKPIFDAIAPFQTELDRVGVEAPAMIRNLLSIQTSLANGSPHQKLSLLAKIANDFGIPLNAFTDPQAQQQYLATPHYQQPAPQPQVNINELVQRALEERETTQTIQQMASNTEKYPFFPYVRNSMAQLLEDGDVTDLDEAYQRALELPEHSLLSSAMQQQQSALEEQRRIGAAQKTAKVARANTLSIKSATPITTNGNGNPSVREAVTEAVAIHGSSARV